MTDSFERVAFASVLVLCIVGVLSLPAFPSQDGPAHSYVSWVLAELLDGSSSLSEDFVIRSLLPPYATLHYLNILMQSFLTPVMTEQVVFCIYLLLLSLGFRYFTRSVFPNRSTATLLIIVFGLNTVAFQGMYNFSIGTGLLFWAAAFWARAGRERKLANAVAFAATVILLTLTHPVALALLLGFLAFYLFWWVLAETRAQGSFLPALAELTRTHRLRLCLLCASVLPCLYVASFIDLEPAASASPGVNAATRLGWLLEFYQLTPFASPKTYVLLLFATVVVVLLIGLAARQQRRWTEDRWFWPTVITGVGAFAVYFLAPTELNGATALLNRFPPLGMYMLAAAACLCRLPRMFVWPFRASVLLGTVAVLASLYLNTAPLADLQLALTTAPALHPGARALIVAQNQSAETATPAGTRFSPCLWGPAYYLQQNEAILENLNWLGLSYLPLRYRHDKPYHRVQQWELPKYVFTGASEPVPELPPRVDVLVSYQCRTGDATLPAGETLTERYGLDQVWTSAAFAVYARPGALAGHTGGL